MDFINYDCNSLYRYVLRFPRTSPLPDRGVPDCELLVFTTCSEDGVAGGGRGRARLLAPGWSWRGCRRGTSISLPPFASPSRGTY